jgi:hypothetical protein
MYLCCDHDSDSDSDWELLIPFLHTSYFDRKCDRITFAHICLGYVILIPSSIPYKAVTWCQDTDYDSFRFLIGTHQLQYVRLCDQDSVGFPRMTSHQPHKIRLCDHDSFVSSLTKHRSHLLELCDQWIMISSLHSWQTQKMWSWLLQIFTHYISHITSGYLIVNL